LAEDPAREGFAFARPDCERSVAHLARAADAVLDSVLNPFNGALNHFDSIGLLSEDASFSVAHLDPFADAEDFQTGGFPFVAPWRMVASGRLCG
jgi:hypothetical protein